MIQHDSMIFNLYFNLILKVFECLGRLETGNMFGMHLVRRSRRFMGGLTDSWAALVPWPQHGKT